MGDHKFNDRTLLGTICSLVQHNPNIIYQVMLSTGTVLEGMLSPFDDQSDYVRVNPVPLNTGDRSYYVHVSHIVYVHERKQQ